RGELAGGARLAPGQRQTHGRARRVREKSGDGRDVRFHAPELSARRGPDVSRTVEAKIEQRRLAPADGGQLRHPGAYTARNPSPKGRGPAVSHCSGMRIAGSMRLRFRAVPSRTI